MKTAKKIAIVLAAPILALALNGCASVRGFIQDQAMNIAAPGLTTEQRTLAKEVMDTGKVDVSKAMKAFMPQPDSKGNSQAVQLKELPSQTFSERKYLEGIKKTTESDPSKKQKTYAYTLDDKLYQSNFFGDTVDLTKPLVETYGSVTKPRVFGKRIFFVKNNGLYSYLSPNLNGKANAASTDLTYENQDATLIASGANISEYIVSGEDVLFISNANNASMLNKADIYGDNLRNLVVSEKGNLIGLDVAQNGKSAVCIDAKGANKKDFIFVDLNSGKHSNLFFPKEYRNQVEQIYWFNDKQVMFALKDSTGRNDLYVADVVAQGSHPDVPMLTIKNAARFTYDGGNITSAKHTPDGLLYVLNKGDKQMLLLNNSGNRFVINPDFKGSHPVLIDAAGELAQFSGTGGGSSIFDFGGGAMGGAGLDGIINAMFGKLPADFKMPQTIGELKSFYNKNKNLLPPQYRSTISVEQLDVFPPNMEIKTLLNQFRQYVPQKVLKMYGL